MSSEDLAASFARWYAAWSGDRDVELRELHRHAEGFSWETFTLVVTAADRSGRRSERALAVRREPADGLLAPYDVRQQYAVHAAVAAAGTVPVPALVALETDPGPLGRPFYVMERVDGYVPVQWRPDDPVAFPTEAAREALGHRFVEVLAGIHAIDWRAAGLTTVLDAPTSSDDAADRQIACWEQRYDEAVDQEVPLLREALRWLRANRATSGRVALTHGDYRIGNFMVRDGDIVAVFDWELVHLSDPVEDIAYSGLRLFRGRSPRYSHLLERDHYLEVYRDLTGLTVRREVLRFWTVLGLVKTAVPHLRAVRAFEEGRNSDLRLAAMGHQVLHVLRILAAELELEVG